MESLKLTPKMAYGGAGIYEAGEQCHVRLFVTDTGRVISVSGRCIEEYDLLNAYYWGGQDTLDRLLNKVVGSPGEKGFIEEEVEGVLNYIVPDLSEQEKNLDENFPQV